MFSILNVRYCYFVNLFQCDQSPITSASSPPCRCPSHPAQTPTPWEGPLCIIRLSFMLPPTSPTWLLTFHMGLPMSLPMPPSPPHPVRLISYMLGGPPPIPPLTLTTLIPALLSPTSWSNDPETKLFTRERRRRKMQRDILYILSENTL